MPEYTDEHGNTRWTRIVYVLELSHAACGDGRSPCDGTDCGRTPVYVGQTCHTAQERFEQHKRGYKASRWVRKYGMRPLIGEVGEFETVSESEAAEQALAQLLRDAEDGTRFCVYGGH